MCSEISLPGAEGLLPRGGDRHPAGEAGPTTSRLLCRFLGNSLTGDGGTACFLVVREKTIMKLKFFFKYKVRFFSKFLKKYAITLKIQYILSWKTLKPLFFGAPNNVPLRCSNDGAFNEKLHNLKYIQHIRGISQGCSGVISCNGTMRRKIRKTGRWKRPVRIQRAMP